MNLSAVDLNLLVAFDALMLERHVTRAGARVGLSQPAMSNALTRLRHLFQDPLLIRSGRVMEPTARALQIAGPVRAAMAQMQVVLTDAAPFDPSLSARRFIIGTADLVELYLLPSLMSALATSAPKVDIAVRKTDRLTTAEALMAGEIDLGIMPAGEQVGEVRADPLFRESFLTVAARGHPALADGLTLDAYVQLPHVMISMEGRGPSPIDNLLAAQGLKRRIALSVPHFAGVPFIVGQSNLIATLPARQARAFADAAGLELHETPLPLEGFVTHLVWHYRHDGDVGHGWLRDQLKAAARLLEKLSTGGQKKRAPSAEPKEPEGPGEDEEA